MRIQTAIRSLIDVLKVLIGVAFGILVALILVLCMAWINDTIRLPKDKMPTESILLQ